MIFDHDEKIILMLYGEDSREKTMESLNTKQYQKGNIIYTQR